MSEGSDAKCEGKQWYAGDLCSIFDRVNVALRVAAKPKTESNWLGVSDTYAPRQYWVDATKTLRLLRFNITA